MPYLNDELREWITAQLATLGVEEIAVYGVDPQRGQDEERRILVATEVGLIDGWYAPRGGSSARYGFTTRLWPWQAVRGVDLRSETYRVWALEHRTRWWLRLARPAFESETDAPELGAAICDFAKVCAVMAEPSGWQAAQEDVPARREQLRVLPTPTEVPPEAGDDVEATAPTGRPVVPPPMVVPMTPQPEPTPIAPIAAVEEEARVVTETEVPVAAEMTERAEPEPEPEPEPDVLLDDVHPDEIAALATPVALPEAGEDDAADIDETPAAAEDLVPQPAPTNGIEPALTDDAAVATTSEAPSAGDVPDRALLEERAIPIEPEPQATEMPAPPVPVAAGAPREVAPGEEAVDLGQYLPGEEPINLDDYDPDPLGLDGPTHPR